VEVHARALALTCGRGIIMPGAGPPTPLAGPAKPCVNRNARSCNEHCMHDVCIQQANPHAPLELVLELLLASRALQASPVQVQPALLYQGMWWVSGMEVEGKSKWRAKVN